MTGQIASLGAINRRVESQRRRRGGLTHACVALLGIVSAACVLMATVLLTTDYVHIPNKYHLPSRQQLISNLRAPNIASFIHPSSEKHRVSGTPATATAATVVPRPRPTAFPTHHPFRRRPTHPPIEKLVLRPEYAQILNDTSQFDLWDFRQYGSLKGPNDSRFRNLVLGLSQSCPPESLAIYAMSLRESSPWSDVVLLVNYPISLRILEIAQRTDIVLLEYKLGTLKPAFINNYHAASLRWILYHRYLSERGIGSLYDKVLFTDVRDVAFQADPFPWLPSNTSIAFQEGALVGIPIAECGWNSGWIKDCFGEKLKSAIQDFSIICSGVFLTSMPTALTYVRIATAILLGQSELTNRFPACERNGVDQGIHNVIIHLGLLEGVVIKTDGNFPIVNVQTNELFNAPNIPLSAMVLAVSTTDATTAITTTKNVPVTIVHQYDRIASVSLELARKYVYWKSFEDEVVLWQSEPACDNFHTRVGADIFMGQGDISSRRAFSPHLCCRLCLDLKTPVPCNSFAFSSGECFFKSCTKDTVTNETKPLMMKVVHSELDWYHQSKQLDPVSPDDIQLSAFLY
jgi:hypothetical protein